MIQLYFLSILCNAASGVALLTGDKPKGVERPSIEERLRLPWANETFRLVLGIVSLVVGVLKFFSPIGGGTPFFGDVFAGLAGLASGFLLIFGFYRDHTDLESVELSRLGAFLDRHRSVFGFGALVAAALHFLIPRLPLF